MDTTPSGTMFGRTGSMTYGLNIENAVFHRSPVLELLAGLHNAQSNHCKRMLYQYAQEIKTGIAHKRVEAEMDANMKTHPKV